MASNYESPSVLMKQGASRCWFCARATLGTAINQGCDWCSWAKDNKPVDGWSAKYKPLKIITDRTTREYRLVESYNVKKCPLYIEDAPRKPHKIWDVV